MTFPNLPQVVKAKAARFAGRIFLRDFQTDTRYTYAQFDRLTDRMAGGLQKLGLKKGERLALLHPNHTDFILGYMSVIKAEGVAVPVNTAYTAREIAHVLQDSGSRMAITREEFLPVLEEARSSATCVEHVIAKRAGESLFEALKLRCGLMEEPVRSEGAPGDPAFIFYTSGTTGSPKGVVLTHRNIVFSGANTAVSYGLRETDVALACLPLVHIFANASPVFGSFNSGGSVVVMERFQVEPVLRAMETEGITWCAGVPTMFGYLLNASGHAPKSRRSLRMGLSGGASLSAEHLTRFESAFEAPVLEVYGLTESTGLVTANPVYGIRKTGSIGVNVPGVSIRVVDAKGTDVSEGEVGELIFRGPNAAPGYWNRPEATAAAIRGGWVRTGDLVRQDEEGYCYVVGRKDEMIVSGGYNIYPREIEEVLYLHSDISEAAVVGMEHKDLGEIPAAFIAVRKGSPLKPEDVAAFCRRHLAPYKTPRQVNILDALPKNATGKILKKKLKVPPDPDTTA